MLSSQDQASVHVSHRKGWAHEPTSYPYLWWLVTRKLIFYIMDEWPPAPPLCRPDLHKCVFIALCLSPSLISRAWLDWCSEPSIFETYMSGGACPSSSACALRALGGSAGIVWELLLGCRVHQVGRLEKAMGVHCRERGAEEKRLSEWKQEREGESFRYLHFLPLEWSGFLLLNVY